MIVVTGGAGFIGSALVWKLNQLGETDILIVDHLGASTKWRNLVHLEFSDYIPKNEFLDVLKTARWAKKIRYVMHLGACTSTTESDLEYLYANNTRYSQVLTQWCLDHHIPFGYASSASTYGNGEEGFSDAEADLTRLRPLNGYAGTKQWFDLWLLKNGWLSKVTGFKFFNVFGPNEYHKGNMVSVINKAWELIKTTGHFDIFKCYKPGFADGEQRRDFVYVKDAVTMLASAMKDPSVKGLYNIGSGQAQSFNQIAKWIFKALNLAPKINYIDMPEDLRPHYQYFTQADLSRTRVAGIYMCTPADEAIKDYVQNYLEQPQPFLE